MDGRNSFGRRISLLNESEGPTHISSSRSDSSTSGSSNRLPSLPRSTHSRTSSYASTPELSPQTPPLSRSDSSDSRIMQIPSPITPDFSFDAPFPPQQQLPSPLFSQKSFFPQLPKDAQAMAYPPMPQPGSAFAYPPPPVPAPAQQQAYMPATAPVPAPAPASPSKSESKAGSAGKPASKKNHYPCPMAKQYNCPDYFTTSGHAARHAKKHTGRKDAVCPECNKAFTRKDNMEQHRRTHQNGRNSQKGDDVSQPRKVKAPGSKRPRPSPLQPNSTIVPPIDPMLPTSPGSSIAFSDAASLSQSMQPLQNFTSPYMEPIPYRYDLPTSFTAGLDTLAIVATGEDRKRKFNG
ncbi:hypothetical protein NA57DRAFT_80389 [Rhizodiscina lignyota]|uniref:C2H2-type domain-containing protein n=1 Tax=Rhizodiscina lignyota TaxID=1504668 RepID=A0A9P4I660_9PEZI|nr:hypothetical protein NA57DRAFT_80389 [Rhizodiscina lignyota]